MISDALIADLCAAIGDPAQYNRFVHVQLPATDDGVCWGVARIGRVAVGVFRPSTTLQDWWRDFDPATVRVVDDPRLGPVHQGFDLGVADAVDLMSPLLAIADAFALAGMSLGGPRAQDAAARLLLKGMRAARLLLEGSPAFGYQQFVDLIEPISTVSYRNGPDPVPLALDLCVGQPFRRPAQPDVETDARPAGWLAGMDPFAWHSAALYARGVAALGQDRS